MDGLQLNPQLGFGRFGIGDLGLQVVECRGGTQQKTGGMIRWVKADVANQYLLSAIPSTG